LNSIAIIVIMMYLVNKCATNIN